MVAEEMMSASVSASSRSGATWATSPMWVALAAALSVEPRFIFCDEPVSALDASARAQVLNLMQDIQAERELSLLIVSHDLTAVEYVCDDIAVMYLGGLVEIAETEDLFARASHPYTEALLSSMPERALDPDFDGEEIVLKGEIPSPVNLPSGCRFSSRCPNSLGQRCEQEKPDLLHGSDTHQIACHLFDEGGQCITDGFNKKRREEKAHG